jgi:hypothetical protein
MFTAFMLTNQPEEGFVVLNLFALPPHQGVQQAVLALMI